MALSVSIAPTWDDSVSIVPAKAALLRSPPLTTILSAGVRPVFIRQALSLAARAQGICELKLSEPLFGAFILAVFCNVMIYIGVEGYRSNPHELGKYLALFFGVCVFILCGFEHCVANMYYFTMGGAWSGRAVLYLLVMTVGNAVGGVIGPLARKVLSR